MGRFHISSKRRHTGRAVPRRINAVMWSRLGVEKAVRFHEEESNAGFLQKIIVTGVISAFRQPNPSRAPTKMMLIIVHRHADLCARRLPLAREGQVPVRGTAGD